MIDVTDENMVVGRYIIEFLNAFQKKYDVSQSDWVSIVKKYKLASRIENGMEDIQEMSADEHAYWLHEYLKIQGVFGNE
jgi:hypothetical protein